MLVSGYAWETVRDAGSIPCGAAGGESAPESESESKVRRPILNPGGRSLMALPSADILTNQGRSRGKHKPEMA